MQTFEALYIVKESAFGTVMASPVAGTDSMFIRLTDGNSFSMQPNPVMTTIPYGGGQAIDAEMLSDFSEVKGALTTKLYPTQCALLLNWALTRVNAGQTAPWTTTEPPGDLASVSCYHAFQRNDGTIKRQRYSGCKVNSLRLEASRGDVVWKATLDLTAIKNIGNPVDASADPDATEFPLPGDADLPVGPYLFSHSSGGLLLGTGSGTVRSQYESLALAVTNSMDARPFESHWIQVNSFRGRKSTLDCELRLKVTPDDQTAYEALTANTCKLTLTSGARSVVIDYKGANKISKVDRNLPLDKIFTRRLTIANLYSSSAGTDLDVTVV
jgi:hypothetical protein